jgi:hypothetical protein
MTSFDELFERIPIDQIAKRVGADRADVERAVSAALPALVGGMGANAKDPAGAASLKQAVSKKDPGLVRGGVNLDEVDPDDGKKIVRNVFGTSTDGVVSRLGETGAADSSLISKVLPLIAPIVMAFLAEKLTGQGGSAKSGSGKKVEPAEAGGGIDIGGLLGGILGGMAGGGGGGGGGIDIGGLLGGLLGGGKR